MEKDEKTLNEQENTTAEEVNTDSGEKPADEKKSKKSDKKNDAELKKLKEEYDALNDRYVRTLAEYDNFRKRTQKDIESRVAFTKTDVLSKILPVVDNFERAASTPNTDFEGYKKGIEMIVGQFTEILKSMGVEEFGAAGDEFDPNIHNGVMHIEDESLGKNVVADVFMKGYKIGDRIIRPATVKVAN